MYKLLRVAVSSPLSAATCERSFSSMRRIKNWLRTKIAAKPVHPVLNCRMLVETFKCALCTDVQYGFPNVWLLRRRRAQNEFLKISKPQKTVYGGCGVLPIVHWTFLNRLAFRGMKKLGTAQSHCLSKNLVKVIFGRFVANKFRQVMCKGEKIDDFFIVHYECLIENM
jgi:hypothetical protein